MWENECPKELFEYTYPDEVYTYVFSNEPDKLFEHNHVGKWKTFGIMKTGYDYGFFDFCFKDEKSLDCFKALLAVYLASNCAWQSDRRPYCDLDNC